MLVTSIFSFSTIFSMLSNTKIIILVTFNLSSANALNLVLSKKLSLGKELKKSVRYKLHFVWLEEST